MLTNYGGFAAFPPGAFDMTAGVVEVVAGRKIRLWVRADGLVVFDFSRWGPGQRPSEEGGMPVGVFIRRSELMNAFAFAIGVNAPFGRGIPRLNRGYVSPDDQLHFIDPTGPPLGGITWPQPARVAVPASNLDHAFELFRTLVRTDLSAEADLLARGLSEADSKAYGPALTSVWPVAERFLVRKWQLYLEANRRRSYPPGEEVRVAGPLTDEQRRLEESSYSFIDATRLSMLRSVDLFTSAVITEVLSFAGEIDMPTYGYLARARRARNKWLHELRPVDSLDTEAAFGAVAALMRDLFDIEFEVSVAASLQGFRLSGEEEELHNAAALLHPWPDVPVRDPRGRPQEPETPR